MTFKQACRKMPNCIAANVDFFVHTMLADLAFVTQHALDILEEEGREASDIKTTRQEKACRNFLAVLTKEMENDD